GEAVGEGVGGQVAELVGLDLRRRGGLAAQAPAPLAGGGVDRGQGRTAGIRGHASATEGGQRAPALGQGVAAAAQRVARLEQGGQVGRQCAGAVVRRRREHRR